MKTIEPRTKTMKRIEKTYGTSVENLLQDLYIEQNLTMKQIADELVLSEKTVWSWIKASGIKTRQMKWE